MNRYVLLCIALLFSSCASKSSVPQSVQDEILREQANVHLLQQEAAKTNSRDSLHKVSMESSSLEREDSQKKIIRPGMKLRIDTVEDENIKGEFQVSFEGEISLPYQVKIYCDGLSLGQTRHEIIDAYRSFFRFPPSISVEVSDARQMVEVQGLVQKPGKVLISRYDSLDEIISQAEGLGVEGEEDKFPKYVRISPTVGKDFAISLREYYAGVSPVKFEWNGGDRIFFQSEEPNGLVETVVERSVVQLLGQVQTPGAYPYRFGESFFHYLVLAGGPTELTDFKKIEFVRLVDGERKTLSYDLSNKTLLPQVSPGDIILVHATQEDTTIPNATSVLSSIATALIAAAAL